MISLYRKFLKIKSRIKYHLSTKEKIRQDSWSLDGSLSEWIVPRLKYLRDNCHGYPSRMMEDKHLKDAAVTAGLVLCGDADEDTDSMAIWKYALDRMISAFEYVIADGYVLGNPSDHIKFNEGMDIFRKYFSSLWD